MNRVLDRGAEEYYSEQEMMEMSELCEDILWEPWQMDYPAPQECMDNWR